jgi:lysozyme family protein
MSNDDILERILKYEGGYTNNPADRGGPTNFGITAADLGEWRKLGRPAAAEEVQLLSRDEAKQIYAAHYIARPQFDKIADLNLRLIVVDSGVLFGTARAARWLQKALGVETDGVIGEQTLAALAAADARKIAKGVLAQRFSAIGAILNDDHSQVVFAAGWLNRAADLLQFA